MKNAASSPTVSEIYRSMAKAYELKAQEAEQYVLSSEYGYYAQATSAEILDWYCGENMPPMQPFGRWWLALSIKLHLPTTRIFSVDWKQMGLFREPYIPKYLDATSFVKCSA